MAATSKVVFSVEVLQSCSTSVDVSSRSSIKIHNMHRGDVINGKTLQFRSSSNSLMDLSSFANHAKMTYGLRPPSKLRAGMFEGREFGLRFEGLEFLVHSFRFLLV